ncbi:hypothetical protein DCAR_0312094 [Daucus carota subsp. sativus]|uniref:Treslin N-terminal domain-containing protein n=1 Tax=Daucus carota subsp. sativus TaxID=79200 RepID=A0AAF0WND8_DAUCS|nr:PREDICTED: uncharacterized protein LOC108215415 [Daucus carota subsp. sativus]WOG92817.1 hypothetical protein DCAR_0312094 [Daucus carota subsp. sativus]
MNYSKTNRILLLIDLNPLLPLQNPNPYLNSILTCSKILLSFPPLSASLFAFKFFFSSLSPLRSSSALHFLSNAVSFNHPSYTLHSLSTILDSLSSSRFENLKGSCSPSQASNTAKSLLQLLHDYDWEAADIDTVDCVSGNFCDFPGLSSNLVLLFSPVCKSITCLAEFVGLNISDGVDSVFHKHFGVVNDRFVSKDIHVSWVDVKYENEGSDDSDEVDEFTTLVEDGIRSLGWGFCSTETIILGSALVPFGLIYPYIGASFSINNNNNYSNNELIKSIRGELRLKVSDISGKPLRCKCCELELLKVRSVDTVVALLDEGFDKEQLFFDQFRGGIAVLNVETVQKYVEIPKMGKQSHNQFLVRFLAEESGRSGKKCLDKSFADRVLQQIAGRSGESINFDPKWQIFLSFLYREDCVALVSISKDNGDSIKGLLKPFTVHSALLSFINDKINKVSSELGIKSGVSTSEICSPPVYAKRKKIKKNALPDITWSTFCKMAYELSDLDLAEVYFSRDFEKSKKMKFLKCWVRQIQKSSLSHHIPPDKSWPHQHKIKEKDERISKTQCKIEIPISGQYSPEPPEMQDGVASASCSETAETFFSNLPKKIQHGLEAEGVDLQILAQRLVSSSIHWLHQKQKGNSLENETAELENTSDWTLCTKLIELLTRDPKKLKRQNDNNTYLQASDRDSTSEIVVREYELQILMRMEILQSEVASSIDGLAKRKLVKQICTILDIIQYLVEGGIHGHVSLYDYAERTIKTRYQRNLGDVVDKIYTQMDLLPFGEEDDLNLLQFNSEDSNHSWKDKQEFYHSHDKDSQKLISTEDESSQPLDITDGSPQETKREEHAQKLSEARKRRERARRFVSFTSSAPDLQRVWAPKQPKSGTVKSQSLSYKSKERERQRSTYTVVCETPMSGNKRSRSQRTRKCDGTLQDQGNYSSSCVSKALFQDG